MRTTIRLDDDLLLELKQMAAETGRTLTAIIEDAIREILMRRRQPPEQRQPVRLPAHGSGGLQPGVDLDDSVALWELTEADRATA